MINRFRFAWQFFRRDWQSGEVKVIFLAVAIAVASVTSIGALNQQVQSSMGQQQKRFLGADLILKSPHEVPTLWADYAQKHNITFDKTLDFASVVVVDGRFKLANVKAVNDIYPLLGKIRVSQSLKKFGEWDNKGPKPGTVWMEPRLLNALSATIGSKVTIGKATLTVAGILQEEPSRATYLFAIAPRLIMHRTDIPKTHIVQPSSRIQYHYLVTASATKISDFAAWLKPKISTGQSIVSKATAAPGLRMALDKADQYLALSSMISVLLDGIAVSVAAKRYGERHIDHTALFSCLGASPRTIVHIYSLQILMIALLAGGLGILLGYGLELGVIALLKDFLPGQLPPPGFKPAFIGLLTALFCLAGFALSTVFKLRNIPPVRVLRRNEQQDSMSNIQVNILTMISLGGLMWWISGNGKMTLILMLSALVVILFARVLVFTAVSLLSKLSSRLSAPAKLAIRQLVRHQRISAMQVFAIGLALMIMMTVALVRSDLIVEWQNTIPENAHNHFAVNIQPYEVERLNTFFNQNNITHSDVMPMVRGRLIERNGLPIMENVSEKGRKHNALQRALNLTWSNTLPAGNKIVAGTWWNEPTLNTVLLSIEATMATELGFKLGDELTYLIGEQRVTGVIQNFRTVKWDSFQPNFYVVLPPKTLDNFPVAYLASFYLTKDNKNQLNALIQHFPTVTVIEIDEIMAQVKSILGQVTLAVEYLALFVLAAGFSVLLAAMQATLDERQYTSAVIRAIGADSRFVQALIRNELLLLGVIAGFLAAIGTELAAWSLYWRVFHAPMQWHLWVWVIGPIVGATVVWLSGHRLSRKIVSQSPLTILKRSL